MNIAIPMPAVPAVPVAVAQTGGNVAETIETLSAAWTQTPGDRVFSGTPAGVVAVGAGGGVVGAIDGLGSLRLARH